MTVETKQKLSKKERLSLISLAMEKQIRLLDSVTVETLNELVDVNDASCHAFMEARAHMIEARGILANFTKSNLSIVKNGDMQA